MSPADPRDPKLPEPSRGRLPEGYGHDVRVSDADRNLAVELLRHHTAEGILTLDEFSDRVGEVFEATTRGELTEALRDLPAQVVDVPETQRRPVSRGTVIAVLSGTTRSGRWRPAEKTTAFAFMGGVELDLREAEIDGSVIEIDAVAIMGGVDIIVPPGVHVDVDGFAFMGGLDRRTQDEAPRPGLPVVRVRGFALMGGIDIRTKRKRADIEAERAERRAQRELERGNKAIDRSRDRRDRRREHIRDAVDERRDARDARHGRRPPPPPPRARATTRVSDTEAERMGDEIRHLAAPDGTVTILFSDIESSTEMVVDLGDRRAGEIFAVHDEIVRKQVRAHGGFEVKAQGDGFMLAFSGASRALRCAIAIQQDLAEHAALHPEEAVRVRMGLNTGEALRNGNDFLGRTVIMAARLGDEAEPGEILVSSVLRELCGGTGEFTFGPGREVELKGLAGGHNVYPVDY